MDDINSDGSPHQQVLALDQLPATAIQALYHSVTGKTETLSKPFYERVLITKGDIENVITMVQQQMQHYTIMAGPTTTIQVKLSSKEKKQFSSWQTFNLHSWPQKTVTSEIIVKIEFLLQLPETVAPQRCVINFTLDSKLPFYDRDEEDEFMPPAWVLLRSPSVSVSIDFVDYLIAKVFLQIIEDWVKTLEQIKSKTSLERLLRNGFDWDFIFSRIGLIGLAAFIATYISIRHGELNGIRQAVNLFCFGLVLYSFVTIITNYIGSKFYASINRSILCSMIVLTAGDSSRSKNAIEDAKKSYARIFWYAGSGLLSFLINIAASYVYSIISQ